MQTHQLTKTKVVQRRVGRGGKRGSYSGKGIKGQKSRAGRRIRPQIREAIKKIHKRRGYFFKSHNKKPATVVISRIEKVFNDGEKITPKKLWEKGLVRKISGKLPKVKILGGVRASSQIKKFSFDKDILLSSALKPQLEK